MLFTVHKNIEDHITTALQQGPVDTVQLIQVIKKHKPTVTKQAVYAALRKLKKDEVVVVHNKAVSLHINWLKKLELFTITAQQKYMQSEIRSNNFLAMADGDRIEHHFKNAQLTDAFWWHAASLLMETQSSVEPIYIYHSHQWFLIARRSTELDFIQYSKKKHRTLFWAAGQNTSLDKYVAKDFDGNMAQYYMYPKAPFPKSNYYWNVYNDYVIEVWLDKTMSVELDKLYSSSKVVTPAVLETVKHITSSSGKNRLIISRNAKRADKLKKLLGKHFFIPKATHQKTA